jgi:protein-S-isoprenylcysteine O-methyltransferase Ste14
VLDDMVLDPLRLYLLAGLVAHKVLWEWLKRGQSRSPRPALAVRAVKVVKMVVLIGIVAQALLPTVAPISNDVFLTRPLGVLLFTLGLATAMAARWQLGSNWTDIESAAVLPEHAVVSRGIYRYVRHPIYAGDVVMLIGLELALNSWLVLGAIALAPVVMRQAIGEERALRATLPGYAEYCARTKRFIPFVV